LPTGIVDQQVDALHVAEHGVKQGIDMLGLTDVAGVRRRLASGGLDGRDSFGERFFATAGDGYARPQSGEQLGGRAADAGATSRHERRTTSK
jgi:hypothetical protein